MDVTKNKRNVVKNKLSTAIISALSLTTSHISFAASNIDVISGTGLTNVTEITETDGSLSFTSSSASALLGIDNLLIPSTSYPYPPLISVTTGGSGSELGNITLGTAFDFNNLYGIARYDFTAHNNIVLSSSISDSNPASWNRLTLNLNPDSDVSGSGAVILNGTIEGKVTTTIAGSLAIGSTGIYRLNDSSYSSLTVDSVDNTAGGIFEFSSGSLNLTASGLTIGANGLLGNALTLSNTKKLTVSGDVIVEAGASLQNNGYSGSTAFSSDLLNSGNVSVTGFNSRLDVTGNIVNDGAGGEGVTTLDGGKIKANNVINTSGGSLNFVSGDLVLTGAGITVGANGLLGNNVVLTSTREIYVSDNIVVESGASLTVDGSNSIGMGMGIIDFSDPSKNVDIINSGSVNFNDGTFRVNGSTTNNGGSMLLAGGTFYTDSISNTNGGTFDFTSGRLTLNNSNLTIGSAGLLGNSFVNTSSRSVSVSGDVTIDAAASLSIDSGSFSANSIINNGAFSFNAGSLSLNSDLTIAATGLLGEADTVLTWARGLRTSGDITIDAASSLSIDGGYFNAGNIINNGAFTFSSGYINLSGANSVTVGTAGLFGGSLVLDNVRHLDVAGEVIVDANANLTLNDDLSSNVTDLGALTNSGRVRINDETLNVAGNITTDGAGLTSFYGDSDLTDGIYSTLTANSVVNTNGGKFNFVSGVMAIAGNQTIGSGGLVNNLVRDPNSKILRLTSGRKLSVAGDVTVESDATLELSFGSGTTDFASNLLNNGTVTSIGSTLNVNGNIINDGLAGAGNLIVNGNSSINTSIIENSNAGSTVQNGGTVSAGSIINSSAGRYELNGGSLLTDSITGGNFTFNSGYLSLSGTQGLTVGAGGLLGNTVDISGTRRLAVSSNVTVDTGGSLSLTGNYSSTSFGADLINHGTVSINDGHRLNVAGAIVNDGGNMTLSNLPGTDPFNDRSFLSVASISNLNGGQFSFDSGSLYLTGAGINIGTAGLLGNSVELRSDRTLRVAADINIDASASLSIIGGSHGALTAGSFSTSEEIVNLNNNGSFSIASNGRLYADAINNAAGFSTAGGTVYTDAITNSGTFNIAGGNVRVGTNANVNTGVVNNSGTLVIANGVTAGGSAFQGRLFSDSLINSGSGNTTVAGGTLITGSITNQGSGSFDFTSGRLELTNSGIVIGSGGLLGLSTALTADRSLSISGNLDIQSGSSVTIDGGSQSFGSITDTGSFAFNSGLLSLTNSGLTVGTSGLLGNNVALTDTRELLVSGEMIIDAGATVTIDGGTFKTDGVTNNGTFAFNSGRLEMTGANGYTVGAGSLLGSNLVLSGSKSLVVGGDVTLDAGSSILMSANTGGFSSNNSFNSNLLNNGDINITAGLLTVAGDVINDGSGSNGTMVLDGGTLAANSITNANGGTFDFVSGQLQLTVDGYIYTDDAPNGSANSLLVGAGGLLGSSVALTSDRLLNIGSNIVNKSLTTIESGADISITSGGHSLADVVNDGSLNINAAGSGVYTSVSLGAVTNNGAISISGTNTHVSADSITNNSSFNFSSGNLDIYSGITIGAGGLLGANVNLSANRQLDAGNTTINNGASLSVNGGYHSIDVVTNAGAINVSGGNLRRNAYSSYALDNTGSINVSSTGSMSTDGISNRGSINVSGTGSLSTAAINNNGSINVSGGTLNVNGALTNNAGKNIIVSGTGQLTSTGDVTNSGLVDIQTGATLSVQSGSVDNYTQYAGLTHVDGTLNANDVLILGGTLTGAGAINGNLTIDDGGIYAPGNSPGTMTIAGNFVLTETGTLHLEAGLDANGALVWDELIVGGDYSFDQGSFIEISLLDGISIDTFATDFGMDKFFRTGNDTTNQVVSLTTGIFDTVELFAFEQDAAGAKTWYSLDFDATGTFAALASVAPPSSVPVPAAVWLFGSGLLGLFGMARRKAA